MWCQCIGSDSLTMVVWLAGCECFDCSCLRVTTPRSSLRNVLCNHHLASCAHVPMAPCILHTQHVWLASSRKCFPPDQVTD